MRNRGLLHKIAFFLTVIGGINWGLIGLLNFNLVHLIFGSVPPLESLIYVLVGLSAVYLILTYKDSGTVHITRD